MILLNNFFFSLFSQDDEIDITPNITNITSGIFNSTPAREEDGDNKRRVLQGLEISKVMSDANKENYRSPSYLGAGPSHMTD